MSPKLSIKYSQIIIFSYKIQAEVKFELENSYTKQVYNNLK